MDLKGIKKEVDEAVKEIPVTSQISKSGSQLTIVFNRQADKSIDYTEISEKVLASINTLNVNEIESIRLYVKDLQGKPEWQHMAKISSYSKQIPINDLIDRVSKFSVVVQLISVVIGTASVLGIFALMLFNSFQDQKTQWEYKTVKFLAETSVTAVTINEKNLSFKTIPDIESQISTLGQEGWELTGTYLEHETAHPNFGSAEFVTGIQPNFRPQKLVLIFKRRKN